MVRVGMDDPRHPIAIKGHVRHVFGQVISFKDTMGNTFSHRRRKTFDIYFQGTKCCTHELNMN